MSLKLAARLVTIVPSQIADLQENDTVTHLLDLSSIVPPGCIAVILFVRRISGTGAFKVYPRSGTVYYQLASFDNSSVVTIENQELMWANTVANDDWDLYLGGYFVQKRTR